MFLGHENDLEEGEWKVLSHTPDPRILVKNKGKFYQISNLCPHQGSLIRQGCGKGDDAVCPYHAWSWDLDGNPISSGTTKDFSNESPLERKQVYRWKGFLFDEHPLGRRSFFFDERPLGRKKSSLPRISSDELLRTKDLELVDQRVDLVRASYINIMDLFLDLEHIPVVHPGLYDEINIPDIDDVEWDYFENGSVQLAPFRENTGSPDWNAHTIKDDLKSGYGAIWVALYPGTVIEWQPGAYFIMENVPSLSDKDETDVHVWKYRDTKYSDKNWEINSKVWEKAWEQDVAQSELMRSTWYLNEKKNMYEKSKVHFRDWLKENDRLKGSSLEKKV